MRQRFALSVPVIALVLSVLALPASAGSLAGTDGDPSTTERIDSADPISFAIDVSSLRFGDGGAASVTLSRSDNFADSLAGSPLTGEGPLLYTSTDALSSPTRAEIARVLPERGRVYILGGLVAVSQAVEDVLVADGYDVKRLAGPSRVETALVVAAEVRAVLGDSGMVAVARGFGPADNPTAAWADSVTAGAWAVAMQVPIVISPTDALPGSVADWLADDDPTQTVLLGGEAALSAAVEAAVPNPRRVSGPDRAATAAAIATDLLGFSASGPRLAVVFNPFEELGWTRGLSVAGLAGAARVPILALNSAGVPPATAGLLTADGDDPQVEVLVAAPAGEVSPQLIAELDFLDAGPPSPQPVTPGVPRIVSVDEDGQQGDDSSSGPDLGGDGTVVTFTSRATNLGDTDPDRLFDGLVRDTVAGTTTELTFPGPDPANNGETLAQSISADNRRIVVSAQSRDGFSGLLVIDRVTGETILTVSVTDVDPSEPANLQLPAISADGQWIAFAHDDGIYRQRVDGTSRELVFAASADFPFYADMRMSGDGQRIVTLLDNTNEQGFQQLLLIEPGRPLVQVSTGIDGQPANEQISDVDIAADGRTIAFTSRATNLTGDTVNGFDAHLYLHDIASGQTTLVDRGPDGQPAAEGVTAQQDGFGVSLTADGSRVVFTSEDDGLSGGGEVVFANVLSVDTATGAVTVEAVPPDGSAYDSPTISGDGTRIAFEGTMDFMFMTQMYLLDRVGS